MHVCAPSTSLGTMPSQTDHQHTADPFIRHFSLILLQKWKLWYMRMHSTQIAAQDPHQAELIHHHTHLLLKMSLYHPQVRVSLQPWVIYILSIISMNRKTSLKIRHNFTSFYLNKKPIVLRSFTLIFKQFPHTLMILLKLLRMMAYSIIIPTIHRCLLMNN